MFMLTFLCKSGSDYGCCLKVILRDIPRTYPELEFFKDGGRGQQSLFNVIKAYSIHDKEVGYCQGSAFIVGQLLLQVLHLPLINMGLLNEYRFKHAHAIDEILLY